jgi:hypothetical protein
MLHWLYWLFLLLANRVRRAKVASFPGQCPLVVIALSESFDGHG